MKHNPRLNEKMARLPGFADIHPLQPQSTVQGALELIDVLADWLMKLTGMPAVAMSPKAGAHGELCGMLAIRAALDARGDERRVVLVPESAHGTNPATAAFCGFTVENIPANARGRVDLDAMLARLGPDVAAVMITNPNTCGLFEPDLKTISDAVHAVGGYVYCDGRQLQRHRRPRAPRRSGRGCHAHQPAQDLLHPARWRRARLWPGRAVGRTRPVRSRSRLYGGRPMAWNWSRKTPPVPMLPTALAAWSPSTARWACSSGRSAT